MFYDNYIDTNTLVFYLCCIVVGWLTFWYFVYQISGFHLLSITVNNGILFNGITLETKRFNIDLKALRFRLWGNTRITIVDELTIKLKHHEDTPNNTSTKNKKGKRIRPLSNDEFDPSIASVNIFPKSRIGRFAVKSLLLIIPTLNLELRQTTIISAYENKTYIEYLKFFARSRYSRKCNEKMSLKFSLVVNNVIHDIKTMGDTIKPFLLGGINLENKLLVNYLTGKVDDLRIRINVNDSDVLVFNAAKYYVFRDEIYKQQIMTEQRPVLSPEELELKRNNKVQMIENAYRFVHAILSEINIHIENAKISEIPFVTMENNTDVKHYFNDLKPATCLELMTKSVSFNFSKMSTDAAGFEVLFNSTRDRPYHLTCSVQLLKVFFAARTTLPTGYLGQTSDEILNVPNVAFTYKTNVLDQLVRSKGFKNCVIEVYFSASTPIFDLDTRQLSALLYNLILIKKWRRLHEFKDIIVNTPLTPRQFFDDDDEEDEDAEEEEEDTAQNITLESLDLNKLQAPVQKELLSKKAYRYLNEFYPRLDIKLVIEQPRIVIRHYEPHKNTQMLSFSYSLLNFSLSTTSTRDYASSCQILYPKITYYEKSNTDRVGKPNVILQKDITSMNYLDLTIDLTNLEIFTGIHYLLLDITRMVETDLEIGVINKRFNQELLRLRHELKLRSLSNPAKQLRTSIEDKLFKYLPHWLTKLDFQLTSLNILLGSRSVLIPKQDLANTEGPDFDFDFDDQHELKQVNFKIESLHVGVNNHGAKSGENSPTTSVPSSASLETLASINYDSMYWSIIPSLKIDVTAICNYNGQNKIMVDLNMDRLNVDYSRYKLCTLIGSVYLIREFMISPIKLIKLKFDVDSLGATTQESILNFITFDFKLDYLDIILRLNDEFKVRLQLSNLALKTRIPSSIKDLKIDVDTDSIRFIQPHQFVVYKLFDNISITVKLVKHLIKLLKDDSSKEHIKSKSLKFTMEDDPFEDYFNKLNRLHTNVSQSWIRKVKTYKAQLREEIIGNKEYLFGALNDDVIAYPYSPPLTAIYMDKLKLELSRPRFELNKVADFIHKFGQGVPKKTEYTLLLPMYASLTLGELRWHLRDYPLPVLLSPRNKDITDTSFSLTGHLVVSEAFVNAPEHIRKIDVPLVPHDADSTLNKFDSLIVEKTLASVKMYTDMQCSFDSDYPTRFIWGTSYNFGIQQTMLNFDKFSKPPVDPSPKLGFWDKMKYTKRSLEVGFKGSRDPYDLFCTGGGFVLSFRNHVVWEINKKDDSKSFFDVNADKVSWYIPNYLEGPLMAWTRSSSEAIYLTESPHVISTLYGYYIGNDFGETNYDSANNVVEKNVINLSGGVHYRLGFLLERNDDETGKLTDEFKPHYEVQLFAPKYCKKGHDSYAGFRSKYINMAISLESNNESSYNTIHLSPGGFVQFFSWWKLFASNMQLPVRRGRMFGEPKQSVKFSQHLFSNKFSFIMKSLFIAHVYRDEIIDLNNDRVECVGLRGKVDELIIDLHQSKSANKDDKANRRMEFHIGEVVLSAIDLRVMHATFVQNLFGPNNNGNSKHKQSKPTYHIHDKDDRWFDIEDFEEAYLASVKNVKSVSIYPLMNLPRFSYERNTHDNGFEDEGKRLGSDYGGFHSCSIGSNNPLQSRLKVLTDRLDALEEQLKKIYKSNETETTKDLRKRILFIESEIAKFHNKFTYYSPQLIWNFNNRNCTLRYIHFKYLSYNSIQTLDKIMQRMNKILEATSEVSSVESTLPIIRAFTRDTRDGGSTTDRNLTSQQRIANYNSILRETKPNEELVEDYLIEIIAPQIQLQSEDYEDSVVIIAAPSIKAKILSVVDSHDSEGSNEVLLEVRYGGLLQDANVFVLNKDEILKSSSMLTVNNPYGAKSNWPPWLGPEITQNGKWAGANNLLIENLSVMCLVYESEIVTKKSDDDTAPLKFEIDIPSLLITSTSSQYFTLYVIIISSLFYSEPMSKVIQEKIKKMKFSIDFEDLNALNARLSQMQQHYRLLNLLTFNYSFRKGKLNNEDLNNYLQLNLERGEMASDIFLLLKTLLTGDYATDSSDSLQMSWLIQADEIILEILEDDRTPIMDIALARGQYKRKELESGSNINKIHIGNMKGFNLIENARYPDFIEPLEKKHGENVVDLEWTMNKSVGGIKVVENVNVSASPLNIKIDEITGEKLMNFIFHTKRDEVVKDLDDEDEFGLVPQNEGANKVSQNRSLTSKNKRNLTMFSVSGKSTGNSSDMIEEDKDIKRMVERSKKYFSVVSLYIQEISLQVTLKLNKGFKRVLNVYDLKIKLPEWNIKNEILSFMDVTKMIEKEITQIILTKNKSKSKQDSEINRVLKPSPILEKLFVQTRLINN
ncbi:Protein FMP27, mitochondrial [Candida viswanathii]|uniref:Protein FMP27, mitochondrial n=1 Tax=Candida viswanathii TaxID=5486 RepID=A0A367XYI0_9ASCO|nr:Protein FMP27, mitochondrial [Candida viswanathii]